MKKNYISFLCVILLSSTPTALYPNDVPSESRSAITTFLKSPALFVEGCTSLAESIDSLSGSLEKLPAVTHTWDPESRQLGNAIVKEFAITALGLGVSLAGLLLVYHSIKRMFFTDNEQTISQSTNGRTSLFQNILHILKENGRSIAATIVGSAHILGGLYLIRNNSAIACTR